MDSYVEQLNKVQKSRELLQELARIVDAEGGRAMLVGGCVRDEILGLEPKDFDCEVYGIEPERLREILDSLGKVDAVGESFTVYKLGELDISLPRRERKVGRGHKGFVVEGDPSMSFEEACSRRDFTINAIMKDALTGEIVDPFDGVSDLKQGVLKVVSEKSFQEDSLRVLRLVQFASRFDFAIDPKTSELAEAVDLSDLPKERIWMELEKMLLRSPRPSTGLGWMVLLDNVRELFPDFVYTSGVGDSVDNADLYFAGISKAQQLTMMLSLMLQKSSIAFLDKLGILTIDGYKVRAQVALITSFVKNRPDLSLISDYDIHILSQKIDMQILCRVAMAMRLDNIHTVKFAHRVRKLGVMDKPLEPFVKGQDLINLGMTPSPMFSVILSSVYDMQMRGLVADKESALDYVVARHR